MLLAACLHQNTLYSFHWLNGIAMFHYWATLGQLRIASPRFSHLHGPWDRKEYLPQNHSQAFGFFEKKKKCAQKAGLGWCSGHSLCHYCRCGYRVWSWVDFTWILGFLLVVVVVVVVVGGCCCCCCCWWWWWWWGFLDIFQHCSLLM